jgi:carbon-monoxide dehydrogenase iron sulfur subunit
MTRVERRDTEPEKREEEPKERGGGISRRDFLVGTGAGAAGLVVGGVIGREVLGKPVPAPAPEAPAAPAAPAAAEGEAAAVSEPKAGYTLVFDPYQCTGCMKCAVACSEKWAAELHPEETQDVVNLEFARIRPMRFQYVDVVNVCSYCQLMDWAEGSDKFPCQAVCPEEAILTVPEGDGKEGYYGMGYMWIDQEKCLGIDKCWRCAEICEDQFASGISFDPISRKAQVCSRCGGDPECVKACPEPLALQWVPVGRNGRYFAEQPTAYAELLYRKMYNKRRTL